MRDRLHEVLLQLLSLTLPRSQVTVISLESVVLVLTNLDFQSVILRRDHCPFEFGSTSQYIRLDDSFIIDDENDACNKSEA